MLNLKQIKTLTIFLLVIFLVNFSTTPLASQQPQPQLQSPPEFNQKLHDQLLVMEDISQKNRHEIQSYHGKDIPKKVSNKIALSDQKNSQSLQKIIDKFGWPKPVLVGEKGVKTAFLILQHAPQVMQQSLLPQLEIEFQQGNLAGQQLALFTDKILIKAGKKQRYGTQLAIVNGEIIFNNIEDEKNLEKRRAQMKMMPMSDYKALLKRMYKLK